MGARIPREWGCFPNSCTISSCLFGGNGHVWEQWQQPSGLVAVPPPFLIVLQPSAETWMANCCFDLTWKKLIDFCVTEEGKKKRCLLLIWQHRQKHLREGPKREITSHPPPVLLNYSNLTHMEWPPRPPGEGPSVCVGGSPPLGDHSSYLWMR